MNNSIKNGLKKRLQKDDELYLRFAINLEKDHRGEFVVISRKGEIIVSNSDIEVLQKAMKQFGSGNFAFRRIGYEAIGKWRALVDY